MSEPVRLLDSSLLVALATPSHAFHQTATQWLRSYNFPFATCPITQGALLRIVMRTGKLTFLDAKIVLASITGLRRHVFVSDTLTFDNVSPVGLVGHQQVTDAYLAELARANGMKLATMDRAQASLHADVSELV